MSDLNEKRTAHVFALILEHDIEWEERKRGGRAMYARPSRGESAHVAIPEIRGQVSYFVCLHELGHVLSPGNRRMKRLEGEVDAWQWALSNAEEEPTVATLRSIKRALSSYIRKAMHNPNWHLPERGSEFHKFMDWLDKVTR